MQPRLYFSETENIQVKEVQQKQKKKKDRKRKDILRIRISLKTLLWIFSQITEVWKKAFRGKFLAVLSIILMVLTALEF